GRVQVHSTCRGTVPQQGGSVTGLSEKPSGADLNTAARGDRPRFGEDATWVEIDRARRGAMPQHRMIMLGAVAIRQANLSVALNTIRLAGRISRGREINILVSGGRKRTRPYAEV